MNWEPFFFYINRFNAILIFFLAIGFTIFLVHQYSITREYERQWSGESGESGFGSDFESTNSIIGQAVETSEGEFAAYYESDESNERKELAGLVIVNPKSGKTLPIAVAGKELLVDFDFLFDQGAEGRPVIGYIAKVATQANYRAGKADLVIGALPAMTKNVVARDVRYTDLPQVRSDGTLGLIIWQTENEAEVIGFRLNDGSVVDRARIELPAIQNDRVSQGPGLATDPALLRDKGYGAAPRNRFAF